jgi:hypothetical protein
VIKFDFSDNALFGAYFQLMQCYNSFESGKTDKGWRELFRSFFQEK